MFLFAKSLTQRHRILSECKSAKAGFVILALLIMSVLLFNGCTNPEEPGALHGTWTSGFHNEEFSDMYIINTLNNTIERPNEFTGTIRNSPNYEAVSGVLIFEITKYWETEWDEEWIPTTTETTANNGKFAATYWRNLTGNSVQLSNAYDGITHVIFNSLSEAQTNFTIDRAGSYTAFWGSYTK
jgi:hypothetical protein